MKKFVEPEIKVTTFEYESLMLDFTSQIRPPVEGGGSPDVGDGQGEWDQ